MCLDSNMATFFTANWTDPPVIGKRIGKLPLKSAAALGAMPAFPPIPARMRPAKTRMTMCRTEYLVAPK